MQPEYYKFTQTNLIEEEYGLTRDNLIHLAEKGDLPLYVLPSLDCEGQWITVDTCDPESFDQYKGPGIENFDLSPRRISPRQFLSILNGEAIYRFFKQADIEEGIDENDVQFAINAGVPIRYFTFNTSVTFKENDIVIMAADLEATEETSKATPVSPVEEEEVWGLDNIASGKTGLTKDQVRTRIKALELTILDKDNDPEGKGRVGLRRSDVNRIINYKRANAKQ